MRINCRVGVSSVGTQITDPNRRHRRTLVLLTWVTSEKEQCRKDLQRTLEMLHGSTQIIKITTKARKPHMVYIGCLKPWYYVSVVGT